MKNYGFADGDGYEITRGWQGWEEDARAFAQQLANERNEPIDFWVEGDRSGIEGEGEPSDSLETVWPE